MGDKRRYLSRNPSSKRDTITSADEHETGEAASDGYSVRYREPQPERPNPRSVPERRSYPGEGRSDSSRSVYGENFACDGLMTEDEARMNRLYGPIGD